MARERVVLVPEGRFLGKWSMEAKQMNPRHSIDAISTRKHASLIGYILWMMAGFLVTAMAPEWALAGSSPFTTGATAASTNLLAILTPIAVVAVMALGAAAWFNKISWGWAVAGIVGICLVFGAQQIVTWIRGMFGV
jgi:type IV secretion system protein VirB2